MFNTIIAFQQREAGKSWRWKNFISVMVNKKGENKTNKMKLCTIKKQIDANTITE
jgi:hypothetical protein